MNWVHGLSAKGRVQILCFLIFSLVWQSFAAITIGPGASNSALDSVFQKVRPLPDTIFFTDTTQQKTFILNSNYPATATDTVYFIHTGTNPDKYPVLKHTFDQNYNFLQQVDLHFTRFVFESNVRFNSQAGAAAHRRTFKSCVFRNGTGGPFFRFAGERASNISFENCLFHNNSLIAEFEFWGGAVPKINVNYCTFDDNDTIFKFVGSFSKDSVKVTNSIFSSNTIIAHGYDAFSSKITGSVTRIDSLFAVDTRSNPSDWKLSEDSRAKAIADTTGAPIYDISRTIRGSLNGKYDAGCWTLLLGGAPSITKQPKDTTVAEGTSAEFTVVATGSEPLHYQWYKNGVAVVSETLSVLNISAATAPADIDTVNYFCIVSNNIGSDTSIVCKLTVVRKPDFTVHPKDSLVIEGNNVSFSASALRASRYYWISGNDSIAEGATLVLNAVTQAHNNNTYRCVAVNIAGRDTSNPATLKVMGNAPFIEKEPDAVTVLKNGTAVFYLVAHGSSLEYTWYKNGSTDPVGTGNDSLVITNASESGTYYCVVSNEFGNVKSKEAALVVVDSTNKNPLLIRQVSLVDRRHVLLTLERFNVLPVVVGDQPYVDTIGIWYEEGVFPGSPIKDVINFVKIPMAEIVAGGSSTFKKVIEVNKRECVTYCFVASPFWKNPQIIPPFDTANGARVFMCSQTPLTNPLTLQTDYKAQLGAIDVTIAGFEPLQNKKDSLEYVLIWYGVGEDVVKRDTLKIDALEEIWSTSDFTYRKRYEDALFSGPEAYITFNVSWRGVLGNFSDTVKETQSVGTPRTVNYVTLSVDSMRSNSVKLKWSIEQGDNIEKVKIWYGTRPIPVNQDFDTTDYHKVILDAGLKESLIDSLTGNTLYYFGLQTYVTGQYWSFVTEKSSASAKTMNPGDLPNAISITDIKFDSLTNRIIIDWNIDTVGISSFKLKTGFWWDVKDENGSPSKGFKKIDSTLSRPDVIYIDLDQQFLVDTTYHFALWMGYQGKDGSYRWAAPESASKKALKIPQPGWQKITYFKSDNDSVSLFNHKVVLKPGKNWSNALYEDTLLVFKPDPSLLKPGFIPVSMGVDFHRNHPSNEIYMTLACDSLPEGYSIQDVFMYQYDEITDTISVLPRLSYDESGNTVTTSFKPHQMRFPFVLMIDTQEPVVTVFSDTVSVVSAKTNITDRIKVSDNIINSKVKLYIYRSDDSLFQISSDATSWHDDTITTLIDSNYVSQNHSVFAWLVVTDERNSKWINISRKVFVDYNNASLYKDVWSPVFSHSILDSPATPEAFRKIGSESEWKYDNVHFRIFTWNRKENNKPNDWVEYSEQSKDLFSFVPGRIFWVKTREDKAINLGKGVTFPLKNTFSDITLAANSFTDVALPVHFRVVIQDILDSTTYRQQHSKESLGFYEWTKNSKGLYHTSILYQPNTVQFNDPGVVLQPGSCYSIYNTSSTDIKLRIPLITEKMSTRKSVDEDRALQKDVFTEKWNIKVQAWTDDAAISPVYCGYSPGKGKHCFPVSPSFSKVRAGVLDSDKRQVHGMVVLHEKSDNGASYPLVFDNFHVQSKRVQFELENWGSMPANYKVAVFNPASATFEDQNNNLMIGAGEREYRFLVAGDETFIANWKNSFTKFSFSLVKAYPNPFRGRIQIRFVLPYSGVNKVKLAVYDQLGRRVWRKDLGKELHPGENTIMWDANNGNVLAAGTYILQLTALDGFGKVKGIKRERIMYMP